MIEEGYLTSLVVYTDGTHLGGLDLASLRLYCKGRSFFVDIGGTKWYIEGEVTRIECDLDFEDIEDLFGADTNFDLTKEDLLDEELTAKIWTEYEEGESDDEITSMTLTIDVDGTVREIICTEE